MAKPAFLALKEVEQKTRDLAQFDLASIEDGSEERPRTETVFDTAAALLKAIAEAKEGGSKDTDTIPFPTLDDDGNEIEGAVALADLEPIALDAFQKAEKHLLFLQLQQAAMSTNLWVEDLGEPGKIDGTQASVANDSATQLIELVGKAQAAGFPDSFEVSFYGNSYTLPQLKELGQYVADGTAEIMGTLDKEKRAKDEPYLEKLSGDKKTIFEQQFAGQGGMWEALGAGGDALDTPDKLAAADKWFVWGLSTNTLLQVWRVRGWVFDGDKHVDDVASEGVGPKPPVTAFA